MNNKIKWLLKKNISFIKPIAKKLVSKNQKKYIYTWRIMLAYIIHSGFISGYQNRYGDNLKPPTNVYHRMTA